MRSIATDVAWFDNRSPVSVVSSQETKLVKSPTEKSGISAHGGVDSAVLCRCGLLLQMWRGLMTDLLCLLCRHRK